MKFNKNSSKYHVYLETTKSKLDFIDGMIKLGFTLISLNIEYLILNNLIAHGYLYYYDDDYHRQPKVRKD